MEARFNVTKDARKALVATVEEITGCKAVYQGAPGFGYAIGNLIIDKAGTLTYSEHADEAYAGLLDRLAERGFICEGYEAMVTENISVDDEALEDTGTASLVPQESLRAAIPFTAVNCDPPVESVPDACTIEVIPDRLIIEFPLKGFAPTALDNLEKLISNKAALIMKAIGADSLPIEQTETMLRFPWFPLPASREECDAYERLISGLCVLAQKLRRVSPREPDIASEKYAFRCFLLRLGFIGKEYAAARKILLSKLPGSGSFKYGERGGGCP